MLIHNLSYHINKYTGEIVKRQRVKVSCDECGKIKEVLYGDYKRRKYKKYDFCRSCSNVLGVTGCKGKKSGQKTKIKVKCSQCNKSIMRYQSDINKCKNLFCSQKCSFDYQYSKNYNFLLQNKSMLENEIAYLLGVILGDGTITYGSKVAKRIYIFCDSIDLQSINNLKDIMGKIRVKYTVTKNRESCTVVAFNLPNCFLDHCGINFIGDKFKANPVPNSRYIKNINMATGLFNSDGCLLYRQNKYYVLSFTNTVKTIADSLCSSLDANGIYYRESHRNKGRGLKDSYDIYIERKKDISKIFDMSSVPFKLAKKSR